MGAKWTWGFLVAGGVAAACYVGVHNHMFGTVLRSADARAVDGASGENADGTAAPDDGGGGGQADSPLVGKWIHAEGDVTTSYEFKGDGTCVRTIAAANGSESVAGHWVVDNSGVLRISLSDGDIQGAEQPHQIRVDSRSLMFIEDGTAGTFTRK